MSTRLRVSGLVLGSALAAMGGVARADTSLFTTQGDFTGWSGSPSFTVTPSAAADIEVAWIIQDQSELEIIPVGGDRPSLWLSTLKKQPGASMLTRVRAPTLNYLTDATIALYLEMREHEAFYGAIKHIGPRRDFHQSLIPICEAFLTVASVPANARLLDFGRTREASFGRYYMTERTRRIIRGLFNHLKLAFLQHCLMVIMAAIMIYGFFLYLNHRFPAIGLAPTSRP